MFQLTLIVILIMFSLDITLSILNYRHRKQPIPTNVVDVYNEKEYKNWLQYTMEVFRLSIIVKSMHSLVLILFLVFDIFPAIAEVTKAFTTDKIMQTILFLGIYTLISYLLGIGFSIYATFSIEERYWFNKSTTKTFIMT